MIRVNINYLEYKVIEVVNPRKHAIIFFQDDNNLVYSQWLFFGRYGYFIVGDMSNTIEDVIE